jgi:hypothetical protein
MTADLLGDAETRYQDAVRRREAILSEWQAAGCPLLDKGSKGQKVEHSLVRMLRLHDVLVDRLAAAVRVKHAGPEPSAVLTPSIGTSPATRLRRVKNG